MMKTFILCQVVVLAFTWSSALARYSSLKRFGRIETGLDGVSLIVDQNNDGFVSSAGVQKDLNQYYDINRDGCVDATEFQTRLTRLGFRNDFPTFLFSQLQASFPGVAPCSSSDLSISAVTINEPQTVISYIETQYITPFINFCEANPSLYTSVASDCRKLPYFCRDSSYACTDTCKQYSFVTTKGRGLYKDKSCRSLSRSLQINLDLNDNNRDQTVSIPEATFDLSNRYDVNNDGCVDEVEFMARQVLTSCGGIGNSELFAQARFVALAINTPTCAGIPAVLPPNLPGIPNNAFLSANINTTIQACEQDLNLYQTERDCETLPSTCRDSRYNQLTVCQAYLNTISGRTGNTFTGNSRCLRSCGQPCLSLSSDSFWRFRDRHYGF